MAAQPASDNFKSSHNTERKRISTDMITNIKKDVSILEYDNDVITASP